MILITKSRSVKQPFLVKYYAKNNECLATSELLKSKRAAWKNIYAMSKNFELLPDAGDVKVWDKTLPDSKPFVYDVSGIRKKAGVRK